MSSTLVNHIEYLVEIRLFQYLFFLIQHISRNWDNLRGQYLHHRCLQIYSARHGGGFAKHTP